MCPKPKTGEICYKDSSPSLKVIFPSLAEMFLRVYMVPPPEHLLRCGSCGATFKTTGTSDPEMNVYVKYPLYPLPWIKAFWTIRCPQCNEIIKFVDPRTQNGFFTTRALEEKYTQYCKKNTRPPN